MRCRRLPPRIPDRSPPVTVFRHLVHANASGGFSGVEQIWKSDDVAKEGRVDVEGRVCV